MSPRALLAACSLLSCSACFASHGDDAVALRDRGAGDGTMPTRAEPPDAGSVAPADAGEPVSSAGTGGSLPASSDAGAALPAGLQVWIGAVRLRDGGLGCGPTELGPQLKRAVLLLELGPDRQLEAASLTVGEGLALPPVDDPDAYYPPDPPWDWHGCPMRGLVPGFEYPLYDARLAPQRLVASVHPADVIKPWCELQPSYPASRAAAAEWGEYLCRPTEQFQDATSLNDAIPHPPGEGPSEFVPEELCLNVNAPCVCDADSCTASPYGAFALDVQLTDSELSGRFGFMEIKLDREQ